jgi:CBS-domain-containing membrane protein
MFAIYTPSGRTFSGPLESLREVEKPQRSTAVKKHQELDDPHHIYSKKAPLAPNVIKAYRKAIKKPNDKTPIHHAYQVMSSPVQALRATNLLQVAIEKFKEYSYQEFPIINNQSQLVGRLSRQQLYEFMINNQNIDFKNKSLASLFLNDASKVYSAEPVTDIRRIAALFIDKQLSTIPIVESNGTIVGIVSRTDIINAVVIDPPLSLWC